MKNIPVDPFGPDPLLFLDAATESELFNFL